MTRRVLDVAAGSLALAAALLLGAPARTQTGFELAWVQRNSVPIPGSDSVEADPGDILLLEVRLRLGANHLGAYGVSLHFDADGANELDLLGAASLGTGDTFVIECGPNPECVQACTLPELEEQSSVFEEELDSQPDTQGSVRSFEAASGLLPFQGTEAAARFEILYGDAFFPIGLVAFQVTDAVATDGADIESAFFLTLDGLSDFFNSPILPVSFGTASVNAGAGTTFAVDSTTDAVDALPGDAVCASAAAECTLRAVIMEANASPGPDTLVVPAGTC